MAAGIYSFIIEQGATTDFEIQYLDSNGDPIDLTGWYGRMQLRPSKTSDTVYLTLSSSLNPDGTGLNFSGSAGVNPPTSGTIGIYISSCTSSAFIFTQATYDLEIYSGSSCPYTIRLLQGNVQLNNEVTR
jgi:hypothetical protein